VSDFIDLKQIKVARKERQGPSQHVRGIVNRLGNQEFTKAHITAIVSTYPEYEHLRKYPTLEGLVKDTLRRMVHKGFLTKENRKGELTAYKAILATQGESV
jgi:hypothetical protein